MSNKILGILGKILEELIQIRKGQDKNRKVKDKILEELIQIRKGQDRLGEFVLELSPSEAKEEIKDLKK